MILLSSLALASAASALIATAPLPERPKRTPAGEVAAANRAATRTPADAVQIHAAQVHSWSEGAIYQLLAAPERVTDIALQPGETLIAVAAGDTTRWVIGDTTSGAGAMRRTHILVKPIASGLTTNLVITTDRRSYHLALVSTRANAMTRLSWTYPQDALIALDRAEAQARASAPVAQEMALDRLRFDYRISGDKPDWRPIRAFDDGRQTFIELPASVAQGEAPPVFVIGETGNAELVNYRLRGRFYVIDRLFERAELRLGTRKQQVVAITRETSGRGRR
ncbi:MULTISPECIES: P-type conjugative transfer protein TrbG [unclassified Sphingomonas]|uniref:P-type conjugative transfer protein TrbG n=1 Tax=unclassified Sphingomonas TaxID=196159 RepID=UPI00215083B2|nr:MULTISPECIES: P-type conjugative transfer protein TrbG [unclassified Sphingomonas]MCR5869570.1 P-type conjugative transfer protein TrbG [Sphingomonas sp. J344]UUX98714.1 P-type conjugative transfer protein TrbG [Sphingomonas sp. J315]